MQLKKALLVVDVQNDFMPKGALAVPQADTIIPTINAYIKLFASLKLPVFATRDWHPTMTKHFKQFGGIWPTHCVKDTKGAQFHSALRLPKEAVLVYKGMDPEKDSYSAFHAEDAHGQSLANLLTFMGIKEIYVAGLATDYCVKFSAIDAIKHGLKVKVLTDAVRGVNLKPQDSDDALKEIAGRGAVMTTLDKVAKALHSVRV